MLTQDFIRKAKALLCRKMIALIMFQLLHKNQLTLLWKKMIFQKMANFLELKLIPNAWQMSTHKVLITFKVI